MVWDQKEYDRKRYSERSKDPSFLAMKRIQAAARRAKLKVDDPDYLIKRRGYNAKYMIEKLAEDSDFKSTLNRRRKRWLEKKLEVNPMYMVNIMANRKANLKKRIESNDPILEQRRIQQNQKSRDKHAALKDDPEYRANKRAIERRNTRLRVMGITQADFDARFEAQNYACGICKTPIEEGAKRTSLRACADHCHATNRFRGILCGLCNSGVGIFRDDPQIITAAITWLNKRSQHLGDVVLPVEVEDPKRLYERKRSRRRKGLDHDEVRKHLVTQAYRCGVCLTFVTDAPKDIRQKACADHCHITGTLRGVLCTKCNTALGLFKDSTTALKVATEWCLP